MPTAHAARVVAVASGSPAHGAGLQPGDELLTLNGEVVRDVIRYQIQADESRLELEIRRGGLELLVVVDKPEGAPLGLDLQTAVFDRVRTCDNHCPFCFIYQLPKGMRRSLYLKDDDYRLSFLYGNFTTLTRFTESDLERVITEQLSPLYVSIHSTDPELRTRLLRNRRGATSLRWLGVLLDAGIEVHGQVVVCPGINDGDQLDETLLGVLDRYPRLATLGVVPLGVSDYTTEPDMRPHTLTEAQRVVELVDEWQVRYSRALGRRLVYASDEYYLLAQRPFPTLDAYDGLPQQENGIGMARAFEHEVDEAIAGRDASSESDRTGFFAWVDGAPAEGYRAPRLPSSPSLPSLPFSHGGGSYEGGSHGGGTPVTIGAVKSSHTEARTTHIVTGELGARVLAPLLSTLSGAAKNSQSVELLVIPNRFFGGNIGVTGLLTGIDVADALERVAAHDRVLLPDVVLSNGVFLDGTRVDDLPRTVEVVPADGASLVRALAGAAE
jgi:putative radical SAM enzyme (TIGR03279 family)